MARIVVWRVAAACAAVLAAGCGAKPPGSVTAADLGDEVARRLGAEAGRSVGAVRCPALSGTRGARARCEVAVAGAAHDVSVTVSDVSNRRARLDIVVPPALRAGPDATGRPPAARRQASAAAAGLARRVRANLTEMAGRAPDAVACPAGLPATAGGRVTCILRAGRATVKVYVMATPEGFELRVDDEPRG